MKNIETYWGYLWKAVMLVYIVILFVKQEVIVKPALYVFIALALLYILLNLYRTGWLKKKLGYEMKMLMRFKLGYSLLFLVLLILSLIYVQNLRMLTFFAFVLYFALLTLSLTASFIEKRIQSKKLIASKKKGDEIRIDLWYVYVLILVFSLYVFENYNVLILSISAVLLVLTRITTVIADYNVLKKELKGIVKNKIISLEKKHLLSEEILYAVSWIIGIGFVYSFLNNLASLYNLLGITLVAVLLIAFISNFTFIRIGKELDMLYKKVKNR